jgi:hypothetical protein
LIHGEFRSALLRIPPAERDAWLDAVFGIVEVPDDGPDLPKGCVPYLPCGLDTLLRMVRSARVGADDCFVDVGSGLGRAALFTHFFTGASAIGIEIQTHLVHRARAIAKRLSASRVSMLEGDAAHLTGQVTNGSVFFLYCPFSGERLERMLDAIEPLSFAREIRICCVDLPLPKRSWLRLDSSDRDLAIYRSMLRRSPPQRDQTP